MLTYYTNNISINPTKVTISFASWCLCLPILCHYLSSGENFPLFLVSLFSFLLLRCLVWVPFSFPLPLSLRSSCLFVCWIRLVAFHFVFLSVSCSLSPSSSECSSHRPFRFSRLQRKPCSNLDAFETRQVCTCTRSRRGLSFFLSFFLSLSLSLSLMLTRTNGT